MEIISLCFIFPDPQSLSFSRERELFVLFVVIVCLLILKKFFFSLKIVNDFCNGMRTITEKQTIFVFFVCFVLFVIETYYILEPSDIPFVGVLKIALKLHTFFLKNKTFPY